MDILKRAASATSGFVNDKIILYFVVFGVVLALWAVWKLYLIGKMRKRLGQSIEELLDVQRVAVQENKNSQQRIHDFVRKAGGKRNYIGWVYYKYVVSHTDFSNVMASLTLKEYRRVAGRRIAMCIFSPILFLILVWIGITGLYVETGFVNVMEGGSLSKAAIAGVTIPVIIFAAQISVSLILYIYRRDCMGYLNSLVDGLRDIATDFFAPISSDYSGFAQALSDSLKISQKQRDKIFAQIEKEGLSVNKISPFKALVDFENDIVMEAGVDGFAGGENVQADMVGAENAVQEVSEVADSEGVKGDDGSGLVGENVQEGSVMPQSEAGSVNNVVSDVIDDGGKERVEQSFARAELGDDLTWNGAAGADLKFEAGDELRSDVIQDATQADLQQASGADIQAEERAGASETAVQSAPIQSAVVDGQAGSSVPQVYLKAQQDIKQIQVVLREAENLVNAIKIQHAAKPASRTFVEGPSVTISEILPKPGGARTRAVSEREIDVLRSEVAGGEMPERQLEVSQQASAPLDFGAVPVQKFHGAGGERAQQLSPDFMAEIIKRVKEEIKEENKVKMARVRAARSKSKESPAAKSAGSSRSRAVAVKKKDDTVGPVRKTVTRTKTSKDGTKTTITRTVITSSAGGVMRGITRRK